MDAGILSLIGVLAIGFLEFLRWRRTPEAQEAEALESRGNYWNQLAMQHSAEIKRLNEKSDRLEAEVGRLEAEKGDAQRRCNEEIRRLSRMLQEQDLTIKLLKDRVAHLETK